jgi:endonuclease-8
MDGFWRVTSALGPHPGASARFARRDKNAGHPGGPVEIRAVLATDQLIARGGALGMLDVIETRRENEILGHLGPKIIDPEFSMIGVTEATTRLDDYLNWPICRALMEQRVVAGIGTIWMAETLWSTKIFPWRPVASFSSQEKAGLLRTAANLINRSIRIARVKSLGAVPRHVHGQHHKFCVRCQTLISVSAFSGPESPPDQGAGDRIVYWCRTCQKST